MSAKDQPLRKDAERNRERILEAARELFAERGLGVTLNDVAHHAGVGLMMVSAVMDASGDVSPELWRRYLRIALQGLRPAGKPLDPLIVPAVEPEQMEQLLIGGWKRR